MSIEYMSQIDDKGLKELNKVKQKILNLNWFHVKVFEEEGKEDNNKERAVMNKTNTVCLFSKTEIGYEIIKEFDTSGTELLPNLQYCTDIENSEIVGVYDSEMLYKIMGVMKEFNHLNKNENEMFKLDKKTAEIRMLNDYPIKIENKHIGFILAPRGYD